MSSGSQPQSAARVYRFHYLMIALISVIQLGGVIDARTHVFAGFTIESFFVPAHYVLYAGWLAVLVSVAVYAWRQNRQGRKREEWWPPGYATAAWGAILFGIAGGLDAVWHTLFGFELNLEVLLSPAHLVLFLAIGLIYFSVLRHAAYQYSFAPERHQDSFLTSLP